MKHTLVAVVDKDARIIEASKSNNSALLSLTVPDLLLSLLPEKSAFRSDEEVRYKVRTINYTGKSLKALTLDLQTTDPAGKKIATDTVNLADLEPGDLRITDRVLNVPALQEGIYLVSVVATADKPVESDSMGISVLPTFLHKGSLEGTPGVAATCRPFTFRYQARNAGNIPPTNGSLKVEIRSADQKQLVYAQPPPFSLEPGTHKAEKLDAPRGDYTVVFRASAVSQLSGRCG